MDFFELKNITVTGFSVLSCTVDRSMSSIPARDFHSLSYRLSGITEISAKGQRHISRRGAVSFVPKGLTYSHIVRERSEMIALHFITAEELGEEICVKTPSDLSETEALFNSLVKSWEQNPASGNIQCMTDIYRIITKLNTGGEIGSKYKNHRLLEPAVEYLHMHYSNNDLSIAYLSALAGISEAYFRRLFEQSFDMPPIKYLKRLRMNCAKRLLETGFYTVSEVAFRSGFSSASYFSSEFRNENGISPRKYMNIVGL